MTSQDTGPGSAVRPGITLLLILAVLLPAIFAFGILYRQALIFPFQDDYAVILSFAADYDQLHSLTTKVLDVATTQTIEYKIIFEHFVVASEMELSHHINFAILTGLGDLFLLPIGYLLWRTYREQNKNLNQRLLAFLPISLLFFSLTYWETLNWSTADLQNVPVICFSLLAVYLLFPERTLTTSWARLVLACLVAALGAFTSPNGFLLGPVGLLILLPPRLYARSVVWCVSFIAPLIAYLYHYTPLVHAAHKTFFLARPIFFLAFLGAGAIPFRWPAAVLGIAILGVLWLAIRARFDRTNPTAFYFTAWVVGTGLMVSSVRGALGVSVVSRYSIYSLLVLIFCYGFLAQYLPTCTPAFSRRGFYVTSIVFAFGVCVVAQMHAYRKLGARRDMVVTGIELYRTNPEMNSPLVDPNLLQGQPEERGYEQSALTNAIQKHVYTLPGH
jgi:hypothetical protein